MTTLVLMVRINTVKAVEGKNRIVINDNLGVIIIKIISVNK